MVFKEKEKQTLNPENICLTGFYVPCNGSYSLPSAHCSVYIYVTVGVYSTNRSLIPLPVMQRGKSSCTFLLTSLGTACLEKHLLSLIKGRNWPISVCSWCQGSSAWTQHEADKAQRSLLLVEVVCGCRVKSAANSAYNGCKLVPEEGTFGFGFGV